MTKQIDASFDRDAPLPMSYEEFLDWIEPDSHSEWVDGEVRWMAPVSDDHSDETGFLQPLMRHYAENERSGVVRQEPFQMHLPTRPSGRAPDIFFFRNERKADVRRSYLEGPADVAVEIITEGREKVDRVEKFEEYQTAGVREYWIIDPERKRADFYRLNSEGRYEPIDTSDGIFRSEVMPGFWLRIEWLWSESRPTILQVLKEWQYI